MACIFRRTKPTQFDLRNPKRKATGIYAACEHVHVRGFTFRHAASFPQRAGVWLPGASNLLADCVIEHHNTYWTASETSGFLYGVPWRPRHQKFSTLETFSQTTGFDRHSSVAKPQWPDHRPP